MKVTTRDPADERLVIQATSLARKLKAADPNGPTAAAITRQYAKTVTRLGYDPIS